MGLINCPKCGKKISDSFSFCPNCGCPSSEWGNLSERKDEVHILPHDDVKRCKVCGKVVGENDEYCESCGNRLKPYKSVEKKNVRTERKKQKYNYAFSAKMKFIAFLFIVFFVLSFLSDRIKIVMCVLGSVAFVIGIPISIVWLIVNLIRKNGLKKPLISIVSCFLGGIILVCLFIPDSLKNSDNSVQERHTQEFTEEVVTTETETLEETTEEIVETETETSQEEKTTMAESETETTKSTDAEPETESVVTDEFFDNLKKNLSEEVANSAYDILKNQIGFTKLKFDSKMEGMDNYKFEGDGIDMVLTASDQVYRVFIPNTIYVFYEDGTVKLTAKKFSDRLINQYDRSSYYIIAKTIVEDSLKNPRSAKFPSEFTHSGDIAMERNGGLVAVQSYVDATNSFGAKVRSKWTVEFVVYDLNSFSYDPIYISIDGNSSGEYINPDEWQEP